MKLEREQLDIDYTQLETEMMLIKEMMENFSIASTDVFTCEIGDLNKMSSGFVQKYTTIVEFLCNQHISDLNKSLDRLYHLTSKTLQEFKDKDELSNRNRMEKNNG